MNELTKGMLDTKKNIVNKQKEEVKKKLQYDVEVGEQLEAMRHSQGWELVEKYLTDQLEVSMNYLLSAIAERDIYFHQATITVIRKLLEKVGVSYKVASNAKEMLKKYAE